MTTDGERKESYRSSIVEVNINRNFGDSIILEHSIPPWSKVYDIPCKKFGVSKFYRKLRSFRYFLDSGISQTTKSRTKSFMGS